VRRDTVHQNPRQRQILIWQRWNAHARNHPEQWWNAGLPKESDGVRPHADLADVAKIIALATLDLAGVGAS
jgi:hypothetical protein